MIFEKLSVERSAAVSLINKLIESSSPILECPLCGGSDLHKYGTSKYSFKFCKCECGMVFQSKYLTQEQSREYYKEVYRLCVPPYFNSVTKANIDGEKESGIRYMRYINIAPEKHLDIGSSTGGFLAVMRETHGCEIIGVEPGDMFRDYSNENGINAVADISEINGKFDLITMAHVLEHFTIPREYLATVKDLLDDNGHLFVEVPNMGVAFSHPLLFDRDTLERMLNVSGFDVLKLYKSNKRIMALAKGL